MLDNAITRYGAPGHGSVTNAQKEDQECCDAREALQRKVLAVPLVGISWGHRSAHTFERREPARNVEFAFERWR